MTLSLALQSTRAAAEHYQRVADQCRALAALLHTLQPASESPMPVEMLAAALKPLGLCIVHRDAVSQALAIVEQTDSAEGLSGDSLRQLERSLKAALEGRA